MHGTTVKGRKTNEKCVYLFYMDLRTKINYVLIKN